MLVSCKHQSISPLDLAPIDTGDKRILSKMVMGAGGEFSYVKGIKALVSVERQERVRIESEFQVLCPGFVGMFQQPHQNLGLSRLKE